MKTYRRTFLAQIVQEWSFDETALPPGLMEAFLDGEDFGEFDQLICDTGEFLNEAWEPVDNWELEGSVES